MKKFKRTPKFVVGDTINHPKHRLGAIKNLDTENFEFFYYVDFSGRKGDGTKVWLPKIWTEKNCKRV